MNQTIGLPEAEFLQLAIEMRLNGRMKTRKLLSTLRPLSPETDQGPDDLEQALGPHTGWMGCADSPRITQGFGEVRKC